MRFGILGPMEILEDSGWVAVARPLRRAVLGYMLLHPRQVVSSDRLVRALWGDEEPVSARAQIHSAVWHLRRALRGCGLDDRLTSPAGGYRLDVRDDEVDAGVFATRTAEARAAADDGRLGPAAELFAAAEQLWRGEALGGAAGSYVPHARDRLDEERLAAREDHADVRLRLGQHPQMIGELTALAAEYPTRQRLTGLVMLALHRCGRSAEAAEAYRRLRARLADELGLDPSRELRELHAAVLRDDPALDTPRSRDGSTVGGPVHPIPAEPGAPAGHENGTRWVPRQLPVATRHFAGRTTELATLTGLIDAGEELSGTVVISAIDGTAGVGKTALAVYWAHRVAGRYPDGQLYANLRGFDPGGSPVRPGLVVRAFLDALGVPTHQLPASPEAQVGLYRTLLSDRRILVLLDNAYDADQVRPLLPGSSGCLVIVTSRNRLAGLVAAEGAHAVTLDLLAVGEARELLTRRIGRQRMEAEPAAVDEIIELCARLPLALTIAATNAVANPTFPLSTLAAQLRAARGGLDALDGGDPTMDTRAVFSWSYRTLTAAAARLFRLLGLHPGPDISTAAAASLAALPVREVRPLLAELTRAHLLTEPVAGRYAFHDLLRAYAGELTVEHDPEADRQAALHRMLDHYLHSARTASLCLNPERDSDAPDDPRAGVTAERLTDRAQATDWLLTEYPVVVGVARRAVDAGLGRYAWQLAWAVRPVLGRQTRWQDLADIENTALRAAMLLTDRQQQAYTHRNVGRAYFELGRYAEAREHLQQAIDLDLALGDATGEAVAHLNLAYIYEREGNYTEGTAMAQRALDRLLVEGADESWQAAALNALGWFALCQDRCEQTVEYCQRALAIYRRLGDDRFGEATSSDTLGYAHHHLGAYAEAVEAYHHAIALFREDGYGREEAETLTHLGETYHAIGDLTAAEQAWRQALSILDQLTPDADPIRGRVLSLLGPDAQ